MPTISLIVLKSKDIEKLKDFYQLLGLDFIKEKHGKGAEHYACQIGNIVFELYPLKAEKEADTTTRLGFEVEDLENTVNVLQAQEYQIVSPAKTTEFGYSAVVKDSEGRSVELYQK